MEVTERFADLVSRSGADIPLDEAALLIAAHGRTDLDVDLEISRLDDLAAGCAAPGLDALADHLFADLGFAGNAADYYDPRNSYLDQVVARRLGIPITLSVLAIVVGRRLGVPLVGVAMPGHFLLRDQVDPQVFVDPFAGGTLIDRHRCEVMFHALHGVDVAFDEAYLEPVGTDLMLSRMLANLRSVFLSRGDRASLVWVLRLRTVLPGSSAEDRADLAAALASVGRFDEAAVEYDAAGGQASGGLASGRGENQGENWSDEWRRRAERLRARLN